jgi:hypothetical protein
MGGSPAELPALYRERSPIHYVENIQGRLLIVQGLRDPNVTPANMRVVCRALDAAGKPYELLTFEDEGHGIYKPKNRRVLHRRPRRGPAFLEADDGLESPSVEEDEVFFRETGDGLTVAVEHDYVHGDGFGLGRERRRRRAGLPGERRRCGHGDYPGQSGEERGSTGHRHGRYFFFLRVSSRALAAPRFGALAGARLTYFSK